jgi:hypothetical protein
LLFDFDQTQKYLYFRMRVPFADLFVFRKYESTFFVVDIAKHRVVHLRFDAAVWQAKEHTKWRSMEISLISCLSHATKPNGAWSSLWMPKSSFNTRILV